MNRQEFIQEAALRLISARPDIRMFDAWQLAESLAGYIYPEKEQEPEILSCIPDGEGIQAVISEIDRLDAEDKKKLQEERDRDFPGLYHHYQKSGYGVRVKNICTINNIVTVKDLVDFGRAKFLAQRNMGGKCVEVIDRALMNLYNIKYW